MAAFSVPSFANWRVLADGGAISVACCSAIGLVFDGTVMRAINDPGLDHAALTNVIGLILRSLLS